MSFLFLILCKQLANLKKEITVQDRRKFELLVKSGSVGKYISYPSLGTNTPFRAPVFSGYQECIRSLMKQGLLGFYKGNLMGMLYAVTNSGFKFDSFCMLEYKNYSFYHNAGKFYNTCTSNFFKVIFQWLLCTL